MKPGTPLKILLALLALAAVPTAATLAAAAEITLKVSHIVPPSHGLQKDFLEPWIGQLEEKTGGEVAVKIYDETTAFGNIDRQADQVRAGVMDMAVGWNGMPRDRYPAASIIETPFLARYAGSGSEALWNLYKEGMLGDDYKDFKVLALFTHAGGLIHTLDKPVRSPEDLKGLRLRTANPAVSAMLAYLGASPIGLPHAAIYENLQNGNIDGLVTTWDLVDFTKSNELLNYHTDAGVYVGGFYFVMNRKKYNSLPKNVRAAIDEISGDALVAKFGDWWNKWESPARPMRSNAAIRSSRSTTPRARNGKTRFGPTVEGYLEGLKAKGVKNPKAIYERAQELVAKYDVEYRVGDK